MGNFSSKIFPQVEDDAVRDIQTVMKMNSIEEKQMCTPVSIKRTADPRSATVGIPRTPIEIMATPPGPNKKVASAIPKHLRAKQYLETDLDLILPAMTPEKRIPDPRSPNVTHERTPILMKTTSGYVSPVVTIQKGPDMPTPDPLDPRSPATAFDRTPISRSQPTTLTKSQTVSPQSTTEQQQTEDSSRIATCETTSDFNIPEIHSVSIVPTITLSYSKNLEECMKACELDNEEENHEDIFSDCEDSEPENQITVIPNVKAIKDLPELPAAPWTKTSPEKLSSEALKLSIENLSPIKVPEKSQPTEKGKIKVWRDSISPIPSENLPKSESVGEEIMIEFDDETLVKSKLDGNGKLEDGSSRAKMQIVNKQIKKVQAIKKEAKGVFEDINVDAGRSRTPLACRSNKGIPGKSPTGLLRAKGLSKALQENTPPNMKRMRSKNRNNGQWDADMSVVI